MSTDQITTFMGADASHGSAYAFVITKLNEMGMTDAEASAAADAADASRRH